MRTQSKGLAAAMVSHDVPRDAVLRLQATLRDALKQADDLDDVVAAYIAQALERLNHLEA